tara:strand:- start:105 stop:410 length:306 start_codon:yes stop_codon:yes gene_type:complete
MNIWTYTIIIGILTFLSRYLVIAYANTKTYSETTKKVLSYVPSAVFPSLIFPAVFYENGALIFISDEVLAFAAAVIVSIIFKNIFLTVITAISIYLLIIFI